MKKKSFIFVALAASISFGSLNVSSISAASQSTAVQTSNLRENVINSGMKYLGTPMNLVPVAVIHRLLTVPIL